MPLPYPKAEANSRARAKSHLSAYASGGDVSQDKAMIRSAISQHDKQLHGGAKTKLNLGSADGAKSAARMDRAPRAKGGRAKATKVNVIVNAGGSPAAAPALPMVDGPPIIPPGPPVAPPQMPPRPMGGGAPMMGGMPPGMPMRARGGKVYDAGAGTGEGRLEKVAAYGKNAMIKDTTKAVKGVKGASV